MFRNDFKTFQYVQRYSLGEASFRENKFMEIANSTRTFSSKNAVRFGVHEEHPSNAAAFIIPFCVSLIIETSGSVDCIAKSDLLNFCEN